MNKNRETSVVQRPDDFDGQVIASDIKNTVSQQESPSQKTKSDVLTTNEPVEVSNTNSFKDELPEKQSVPLSDSQEILKKVGNTALEPLVQSTPVNADDEDDLLAFLPSIRNVELNDIDLKKQEKDTPPLNQQAESNKPAKELSSEETTGITKDSVSHFFNWLQRGIQEGNLKTNQAKARIHRVNDGVILITLGIFQDYITDQVGEKTNCVIIQQKVLKKNWHVLDKNGLNVVKYQVKGKSKQTTINAILFNDESKIFGSHSMPENNPHLIRVI